eukprot:IDg7671t1
MSSLNSSSVLPSTLAACPPLIDIASFLERSSAPDDVCIASSATGDALLDSAARFGYAHLTGHGIPCDVTSRLLHVSQHFFHHVHAQSSRAPRQQPSHFLRLPTVATRKSVRT